jgi:hypothetical protein
VEHAPHLSVSAVKRLVYRKQDPRWPGMRQTQMALNERYRATDP